MRNTPMTPSRRKRYFRITLASVILIVAGAMLLPLIGYLQVGLSGLPDAKAQSQTQSADSANPRSNYWRAVREGQERVGEDGAVLDYSSVTGKPMPGDSDALWINREANNLINGTGQNWRQIRNRIIAVYGGWILFGIIVAISLFYVIRGKVKLEDGNSGVKVQRWTPFERFVHWVTAVAFVILAATGLSLLFGRTVLIPLMGPEGFSVWATMAMGMHEFFGPWVFTPGVVFMIILWLADNIPEKGDLEWFIKGGGMVGKGHPSSGRLNAGEKVWFWFIATFGAACVVSGIILCFPTLWEQTRDTMQLAHIVHGACSLMWIAFWLGHAYIGTIGSEGSLEAMTTGYVDVNWAKQHHDLWYEEIADNAEHTHEGGSQPPPTQPDGTRSDSAPTTA
ncbi:formate dehydrogenase subunit gamma [Thioalkalivibrio sp. HK1]|uniref:formate dehydrogenase subunit gamma n=1 Tax=Thioalkalivibrio sp. HK1 TaxID=1469245 RepID=UPI00046F8164|nr:formate dehydrogenase subunit gamma [Thioalkalivibrio sp. HK1]